MRVYLPLTIEQKNKLSQRALDRARKRYPVGTRLRKLTVLDHVRMFCHEAKTARSYWAVKCKCDCGRETIVRPSCLSGAGRSESCGCEGIRKRTESSRRVWMLPPGEAAARSAYFHFTAQANHRGIAVVLTIDQFKHITQKPCYYCGDLPSKIYGPTAKGKPRLNGSFVYNGIDRVCSSKNYTMSNSVPCCKNCNYAKHKMSTAEFKEWLRRAASCFLGMR